MEKNINLYVYKLDEAGNIVNFETTNVNPPSDDCLSVMINLKESLQIEKLKINTTDTIPKVEHKERLLDVKETEFGWELTSEVIENPAKSERELQREALLKQLAELDSEPSE